MKIDLARLQAITPQTSNTQMIALIEEILDCTLDQIYELQVLLLFKCDLQQRRLAYLLKFVQSVERRLLNQKNAKLKEAKERENKLKQQKKKNDEAKKRWRFWCCLKFWGQKSEEQDQSQKVEKQSQINNNSRKKLQLETINLKKNIQKKEVQQWNCSQQPQKQQLLVSCEHDRLKQIKSQHILGNQSQKQKKI